MAMIRIILFSCLTFFSYSIYAQSGKDKKLVKKDGSLFVVDGGRDLLAFRYEMHYPPPGVDSAYKRNGYFHPVYTPHGQVLTRINAPDHYHHYGIWNPWTRIQWKGQVYDLWNLYSRQGTVRFEKFSSLSEKKGKSSFTARLNHLAFTGPEKKENLIMTEDMTVHFYHPENNKDQYFIDLVIELSPATDSPVILKEYRYGGLGWRATEEWNKDNSMVLTSEGLGRKEADGSLARWVVVEGSLGNERGGMLWFSHPSNYNHPEPLRIWPEDSNKRGDMFANFSPTKNKDWVLDAGKKYTLRYRILVYNGSYADHSKADQLWNDFAQGRAPVTGK